MIFNESYDLSAWIRTHKDLYTYVPYQLNYFKIYWLNIFILTKKNENFFQHFYDTMGIYIFQAELARAKRKKELTSFNNYREIEDPLYSFTKEKHDDRSCFALCRYRVGMARRAPWFNQIWNWGPGDNSEKVQVSSDF